jgi:hypothetical protein
MTKRSTRRKGTPKVQIQMTPQQQDLEPDFSQYEYVLSDLKRVAILAGAMFGLLILASFFLQ